MKICDTVKKFFKRSGKSLDEQLIELKKDMINAKIPVEEFDKKCKNLIDCSIKMVSSLTKEEKEEKIDEVSRGLQYWNGVGMEVLNFAPLIKRKYEITRQYLKEYQDALRKSTN